MTSPGQDAKVQRPGSVRVVAVIPARLQSQRLPHKLLRFIAGRPLLAWTYEAALAYPHFDRVLVAVDSPEIAALCEASGWPYQVTSPALPSGTDRLFAVSQQLDAEIYVNLQGDEPLVTPAHLEALLRSFEDPSVEVATLRVRCVSEEVHDPNVVKVVTDARERALYFSRSAIPFDRDHTENATYWKHMGIYAYRRAALARFAALAPSPLEQIERLEQLRLLENGMTLHVAVVQEGTIGVDTEDDLQRVEKILQDRARPQP